MFAAIGTLAKSALTRIGTITARASKNMVRSGVRSVGNFITGALNQPRQNQDLSFAGRMENTFANPLQLLLRAATLDPAAIAALILVIVLVIIFIISGLLDGFRAAPLPTNV